MGKILHAIPFDDLKALVKKICTLTPTAELTAETISRMREIVLDILPTLTRTDILPLIWELQEDDIIGVPRTILMVNLVTLTAKPSPRIFHDLMIVKDKDFFVSSPMMRKTL